MGEDKPVELTEEEKALWYRKTPAPDLLRRELATGFAHFSLPSESEGFDDIRFVWDGRDKCASIMKEWVMTQKKTQRVEELKPSDWFTERWEAWQEKVKDWKRKQTDAKKGKLTKKEPEKKTK